MKKSFSEFLRLYGNLNSRIIEYLETNNIYLDPRSEIDENVILMIEEKFGKPSFNGRSLLDYCHCYRLPYLEVVDYLKTKNINSYSNYVIDDNLMSILKEKYGESPIGSMRIYDFSFRYRINVQEIINYLAAKNIHVTKNSRVSKELETIIEDKFGQRLNYQNMNGLGQTNNAAFSFLRKDYGDLYQLCSDVAKFIETEKSMSMLKARQAIEVIVKYLGAESDDLFENINYLDENKIASSHIIEKLHFIRKKANKSVHNNTAADTEGVLDALTDICVWLFVEHDKRSFSIDEFSDKERICLKSLL